VNAHSIEDRHEVAIAGRLSSELLRSIEEAPQDACEACKCDAIFFYLALCLCNQRCICGTCSLFHLYNVLENPYGRFLIFKRVLKLAVVGKATELVIPNFKRMDSFLLEWNVSESDKRDIFLSATNILKDQKGYGSLHYKLGLSSARKATIVVLCGILVFHHDSLY